MAFQMLYDGIITVVLACYVSPIILIPVVIIGYLYVKVLVYSLAALRETYRTETITRSPAYSFFSETYLGTTTIKTFKKKDDFI